MVTARRAARLVALARVDMVGSTAALAVDGVTAAVGDRRHLAEIVRRAATAAGGSVVAIEGDAAVIACPSTTGAVAVAAEVCAEARAGRFEVRAGVTVGELAGDRSPDLPALDEPLASRLESVERASGPSAITIDGLTMRMLAGATGVETEAVGPNVGPYHRVTRFPSAVAEPNSPILPTELRAVVFSRFAPTDAGGDAASRRNLGSVLDGTLTDGESGGLASILEEAAELVTEHGGTIVDANGPGHVSVFTSGREALAAANAIHGAVAAANLRTGVGPPIAASMSMAVGEVTVGGDDTYGRPVVEAARLLNHAANGTALTADGATIVGLAPGDAESLGSIPLKGFDEAPTVYRIRPVGPPSLVDLPPTLRRPGRFAFVGRSEELASLRVTWRSVCDGEVAGVVVSGEEGAGKTRLTNELAIEVAAAGGIVLFGAADEELPVPYAAIAQALSAAAPIDTALAAAMEATTTTTTTTAAADDVGGRSAAAGVATGGPGTDAAGRRRVEAFRALFAPIGGTRGAGPGLVAGAVPVDRHELFAELSACVGRLSCSRPVLLIIDDLQWVGADTIELIDHLLADPAGERLMVLATVRSENLGPENPVHRLIRSSRHTMPLIHHRLDRLDQADVAAMLASRAGAPLTDGDLDFVAEVTRATGGSPLFVEELVVYLAAIGALEQRDGRWELVVATDQIPIPETILDLMARRLARLGSPADEILPVAAMAGPTFTVDLVAGVLDQPIEAIIDVIDGGVDVGLLHDDGPAGSFSFADEITRAAALRPLRPARRALLHRSIAEHLEGYQPQPIDALAHHWELAIGRDAVENTIRYQRMAAARDMSAAAWESAIDRLRRVTAAFDSLGFDDDRVRADVHYDLGYSLRMIGDDSHIPDLITAADLARRLGDGGLLARAATAMMRPGAWYPEAAVVDDQISEMYQDALYLLPPDDPTRPRVLAALATNLAYDPDAERRRMLLREAQQAAEELGDRQLMAVTAAAELIACQEPDLFERRWTLASEVRRAGQATGDRDLAFTGGFFMMLEHIGRGEMDEATVLADDLRRLAEASRSYWLRFLIAHFESMTAIARCSPDALEVIEAERLAFEDQPVDWFGVSVIQQAVVAMGRGTLAEMLVPFAEAQAQYSDNDEWSRKWNYAVAKAYLDSGRHEDAAEVMTNSPDLDFDRYWLSSMLHLGQVGLVLGRVEDCERVLSELDRYRGRFALIGVGAAITGQVSTGLGQAALGLGRLDQAEELFREAVAQAEAVQFPFFETVARRHLAMTLVASDPADGEAVDHLDAAAAMAERYGFALEAAAIESVRADIGR